MVHGQPKWVVYVIALLLANVVLGFVPFYAYREGMRFMPGPTFVAVAELPVTAIALALTVATIVLASRMMPRNERGAMWKRPVAAIPGFLAASIFVGLPFYQATLVTLPMMLTFVTGTSVSLDYSVKNDNPRLRGKRLDCCPAVSLRGMPLLYNRACHLPEDVKNSVDPGDMIRLEGRGNMLGVHFRTASRGETAQ